MKKNLWHTLLGIIIGGIFLFLTLKNKPLHEIFASIGEANGSYILLSGLF